MALDGLRLNQRHHRHLGGQSPCVLTVCGSKHRAGQGTMRVQRGNTMRVGRWGHGPERYSLPTVSRRQKTVRASRCRLPSPY
jgi:hypothetical protein